jgi:polyphosphate kinase
MTARGPIPYFNREISWLEFNARVLEEAQDSKNPLLERMRFFCIYHSNLDEFFMVRVASLIRRIEDEDGSADPSGLTPYQQLESIYERVRALQESCEKLYNERLTPALAKEKIRLLTLQELRPDQQEFLDEYFAREISAILTPIAIDQVRPFPRLAGLALNLGVLLVAENSLAEELRLAIVQVPNSLPGLCILPGSEAIEACWLRDVIGTHLSSLFPGYRIIEVSGFRLTRDSEVEPDDEGQYDYLGMIESEIKRRRSARPIRLEYDAAISEELLGRIRQGLEVEDSALFPMRYPLDPKPLLILADMPGFDRLRHKPQPPLIPAVFEQNNAIFDIIRNEDILLHHPYESFDPVIEFIQAAAEDPDVLAIKQTLYRTSGEGSPILEALVRAAERGKQVTVLIELTARFDEERNIHWARDLEEAGAHVLYGMAGLKVHAKIALVVRRDPDSIRRYVHLGTGNYNEKTARVYTDFGLLTAAEDFGADASSFFNTITGYSETPIFRRLVMSPAGMRKKILTLIRREADWAKSGQISGIMAKMNSLVDPKIIKELYAAASCGVPIQLNVRGICCLRAGVPGLSDSIRVVSIVDRYLEHSRALVFRNGGNAEVYISSADWMPRNLDRRIELMFPVVQDSLRKRVIASVEAQFADNQKARLLKPDGSYERISAGRSESLRAQEYLYRQRLEDAERIRSIAPAQFVPIEAQKRQDKR